MVLYGVRQLCVERIWIVRRRSARETIERLLESVERMAQQGVDGQIGFLADSGAFSELLFGQRHAFAFGLLGIDERRLLAQLRGVATGRAPFGAAGRRLRRSGSFLGRLEESESGLARCAAAGEGAQLKKRVMINGINDVEANQSNCARRLIELDVGGKN